MHIIITFNYLKKFCDVIQIDAIYKLYEPTSPNKISNLYRIPLIQIAIYTICNNGTTKYVLSNKYSLYDVKTI